MPLHIPPIFVDIPLREYEPSYGDVFARVWANPPLPLVRERADMARAVNEILIDDTDQEAKIDALEALRPRRHAWIASLLGHGEASEPRWMPTANELDEVYEVSPDFVRWLGERVGAALDSRLEREKKA